MDSEIVLLAEDDNIVRELMKVILSNTLPSTFEVITTKDGEEACSFIRAHGSRIAAVVTDYDMPKINGGGVIQSAIENRVNRVILMSASPPECLQHVIDMANMVQTMHFRYLPKPSMPVDIQTTLNELLGNN